MTGLRHVTSDKFRIPKLRIPQDATLGDICHAFKDPEEFVRNVLAALVEAGGSKNADIRVRLLLSSNPAAPDYEIVELMEDESGSGGFMELSAFSGRTHKELDYLKMGEVMIWGDSLEGYGDLQQIIGKLRGKI